MRGWAFRTCSAVAAAAAFALVGASGAFGATVVIGQTFSTAANCSSATIAQPSVASYVVPAGSWDLTSWSTYPDGFGGSMSMLVLAPTGTPGSYTVVGESPVEPLVASTLNTFPLASPLAVEPGDVLGMWESGSTACVEHTGSASVIYTGGAEPTVNSTVSLPGSEGGDLLNISATLVSRQTSGAAMAGYCAVAGDTWSDGAAISPGTFLVLQSGQPDTDPHYAGAIPAFYYEGVGISCDNLPGYTRTGEIVGYYGHGDDTGGIYPFLAKT